MLKRYRRIRRNLPDESNLKRYLVYAFMPRLRLICVLLLHLGTVFAQSPADSLINAYQNTSDNWERAGILLQLTKNSITDRELDKAYEYVQEALQISRQAEIDSIEVQALQQLGRYFYYGNNLDSALFYLQQGQEMAVELDFKSTGAEIFNTMGAIFRRKAAYREAITNFTLGIELGEAVGDRQILASLYNNLGNAYTDVSQFNQAIESYERSLAIKKDLGDSLGVANSMINIGLQYSDQNDLEKATDYIIKSLRVYDKMADINGVVSCYINLGSIHRQAGNTKKALEYLEQGLELSRANNFKHGEAGALQTLGNIYGNTGDHQKAIDYQLKAADLYQELGMKNNLVETYSNIGIEYHEAGDYENAVRYLRRSLSLARESDSPYDIANSSMELGRSLSFMGKNAEAIRYLQQGKEMAKKAESTFLDLYASLYLSEHFERMGMFRESLDHYQEYKDLSDKMSEKQNRDKISKIQAQYDWDKQEGEIKILNQENQIKQIQIEKSTLLQNFLIALAILLFLVTGGVVWSNRTIARAKQRSENLLLNILPAETAEELKKKGSVKAKLFDEVTVLFSDFKEFSKHAERIEPNQLVKSIDFYFRKFDEITTRYGLEKIKTIGDAYMCAGGLPTENLTHAKDVINAAKEMIAFVDKELHAEDEYTHFEIRIGVHTGSVVAGIVGIKKWQYDIWGDTVNIASRMESNSEPGKINLTENTYEVIKDEFECELRGEIEIKNRGLVKMYFLK